MQNMIKKSVIVGFTIGIFFSASAFFGNFPIDYPILWAIPFFAGVLSGLGTIVSVTVSNHMASKGIHTGLKTEIIGFIAAALVNCSIVMIILSYFGVTKLTSGITMALIVGLALGAIYAIYSYRVGKLNERMEFLQALADKNRQLQEASRKLAIIEERNRMSRELHDSISQGLHGLIFTLHSLRNELSNPPQKISDMLSHMEVTAKSTLDELRAMIEELKPSLLAEEGLEESLRVTANLVSQRQKIPVEIQLQLPKSLSPEVEMAIYRITQEALANIEKHASAQKAFLKVYSNEEKLHLSIIDDGKGFHSNTTASGNGLNNMRQRAEILGGTIDISSKPGLGTSITAEIPLKG